MTPRFPFPYTPRGSDPFAHDPRYKERFEYYLQRGKRPPAAHQMAKEWLTRRLLKELRDANPELDIDQIAATLTEETKRRELEEQERKVRQRRLPAVVDLPDLNTNVLGLVAYRRWELLGDKLKSTAMSHFWKTVTFADEPPTEDNNKGLYCVSLQADTLLSRMRSHYTEGIVCGLVEARGKIIVHTDGVLRAEYARILYLFVSSYVDDPQLTVRALTENYPYVPIYVLHPKQLAEVLFRETVKQYLRGADGKLVKEETR